MRVSVPHDSEGLARPVPEVMMVGFLQLTPPLVYGEEERRGIEQNKDGDGEDEKEHDGIPEQRNILQDEFLIQQQNVSHQVCVVIVY